MHEGHHRFVTKGVGAMLGVSFIARWFWRDFFETLSVAPRAKTPVGVDAMFAPVTITGKRCDFSETVFPVATPGANMHEFGHWLFAFAAKVIES